MTGHDIEVVPACLDEKQLKHHLRLIPSSSPLLWWATTCHIIRCSRLNLKCEQPEPRPSSQVVSHKPHRTRRPRGQGGGAGHKATATRGGHPPCGRTIIGIALLLITFCQYCRGRHPCPPLGSPEQDRGLFQGPQCHVSPLLLVSTYGVMAADRPDIPLSWGPC